MSVEATTPDELRCYILTVSSGVSVFRDFDDVVLVAHGDTEFLFGSVIGTIVFRWHACFHFLLKFWFGLVWFGDSIGCLVQFYR